MKINTLVAASLGTALLCASLALPVTAAAAEVPADKITAIKAALAAMKCEVDASNVERDGDGYELDDVFCADGQYDMKMSADFKVTSKRKE